MQEERLFERYFTLEEAAGMISELTQLFEGIHRELAELKDQMILYKRFQLHKQFAGDEAASDEQEAVVEEKRDLYKEAYSRWVAYFLDRGIQVKDLEKGLVDFPYRSREGEEYLLCWHVGEDALFYFHDPYEGFRGRKPITLLPD